MSGLAVWLRDQLEQRGLTQNALAVYANVSQATISDILNKDYIPKVEALFRLADYFGTSRDTILRLAGHLPPEQNPAVLPTDLQAKADEIMAIWERLMRIDPESAHRLASIALMQAEMVRLAAETRLRGESKPQPTEPQTTTD